MSRMIGNGLPGDAVELVDRRGEPVVARADDHAQRGDADRAQHVGKQHQVAADTGGARPMAASAPTIRFSCGRRLHGLAIDAVHLLEQAAIVLRQPDDHRLAAGRTPGAGEALQQPGAERVELAHPGHVDLDAS